MAFTPLNQRPIAWVDCETSGLNPDLHEIIDIAVVFDREIVQENNFARIHHLTFREDFAFFSTRVRPTRMETADPKALEINGYAKNPQKWDNAPVFSEIAEQLHDMLRGAILVGQNVKFDINFLEAALRRSGISPRLGYHSGDTVTLALEHLVPCGVTSISLDHICPVLGISNEQNHTAFADALRCRAVYKALSRASWLDRLRWRARVRWPKVLGKPTTA